MLFDVKDLGLGKVTEEREAEKRDHELKAKVDKGRDRSRCINFEGKLIRGEHKGSRALE